MLYSTNVQNANSKYLVFLATQKWQNLTSNSEHCKKWQSRIFSFLFFWNFKFRFKKKHHGARAPFAVPGNTGLFLGQARREAHAKKSESR